MDELGCKEGFDESLHFADNQLRHNSHRVLKVRLLTGGLRQDRLVGVKASPGRESIHYRRFGRKL